MSAVFLCNFHIIKIARLLIYKKILLLFKIMFTGLATVTPTPEKLFFTTHFIVSTIPKRGEFYTQRLFVFVQSLMTDRVNYCESFKW